MALIAIHDKPGIPLKARRFVLSFPLPQIRNGPLLDEPQELRVRTGQAPSQLPGQWLLDPAVGDLPPEHS